MNPLAYERHKATNRRQMAEMARDGRDIGSLPRVADPERRLAAGADFRLFCDLYFALTFDLAWSDDHLKVIGQIERSVRHGGLFATAMPRGSGKTVLCERACIWAMLYGYRQFVCLVGSDEDHAKEMLDSIKGEFEANELLQDDFPEACLPISRLDGIANRCSGQLYDGRRTHIEWTKSEVVLPTLKPVGWLEEECHRPFVRADGYSTCSGAIVRVAGLTGGIRGMKHRRADGATVRPSLVVLDDPQTDGSARSPSQCETRERILAGAILGLAGPGKKISGIMPCTVVSPGDMADNILDRKKHPEWNGTRTRMVYAFPTEEKLWEEYKRIRDESLQAERGGVEATEFYRAHREAMDAGAVVAWEARFEHDELSAIQHAMNLRFRNERAFRAEYQNDPLPEDESRPDDLTADQICAKLNRLPRGRVPTPCNRLTGFIDVQGSLLYYLVCAWEDDFTGYVIDYGSYPDQKRPYFTLADARNTLARTIKGAGLEGQIYGGLEALTAAILGRDWPRDDDTVLRVERLLIDANWAASTRVVHQICRQSPHAAALTPSHGKYIGAAGRPMAEWSPHPGEKAGHNWRFGPSAEVKGGRKIVYDTNYWKSFVHTRLATAMGDRGCLSLFGDRADAHRMLADHLTAEFRVRTSGRGREVDEWRIRPERPDNHYLDTLVGCAVAASMQGVALAETKGTPATARRRRMTMAEMSRQGRPGPPTIR